MLVRRTRRSDGGAFLSCSSYPDCKFAEDLDPHLAKIAVELNALRAEIAVLRADLANAKTHGGGGGASNSEIAKKLRDVIAFAHPDRWPAASILAHGVTSRLNAIREAIL